MKIPTVIFHIPVAIGTVTPLMPIEDLVVIPMTATQPVLILIPMEQMVAALVVGIWRLVVVEPTLGSTQTLT